MGSTQVDAATFVVRGVKDFEGDARAIVRRGGRRQSMDHEREHGRRGSGARRHGDVFIVFGSRDGFRQRERGRRGEQGGDDENFIHIAHMGSMTTR